MTEVTEQMLDDEVRFTEGEHASETAEHDEHDVTPAKRAKSTKAKAPRKPVTFSSIHVRFASKANIDVTRAAKLNRSYIRSNYDVLVTLWPALKASQKVNRDSNRYPTDIPAKVADMIVTRTLPTKVGTKAKR